MFSLAKTFLGLLLLSPGALATVRKLSKSGGKQSKAAKGDALFKFSTIGNGAQIAAGLPGSGGIDTDATLSIDMVVNEGMTFLNYALYMYDAVGVTQVHLHCGLPGSPGPVLAFLYGLNEDGANFDGLVSEGSLTYADIVEPIPTCGPFVVDNIAALFGAIKGGLVYVQAHTLENPGGEVRGQFYLFPN